MIVTISNIIKLYFTYILWGLSIWLLSSTANANEPIKIGMTGALTGPSAALGNNIKVGIESYFKTVNDSGGIHNRFLELLVLDDGYEPEQAALNMRSLIEKQKVLTLIGNIGTPTAIVTTPIAKSTKTLMFGALSGGDVLREVPPSRYIINYRASYAQETQEIINGLLQVGIKPQEIAFFTQRDGFGDAVYQGATEALQQHGYDHTVNLVHGRYTRNSLNVEDAAVDMFEAAIVPKVIIMGGSYAPSAKFIKLIEQELPNTWFINVSFVGSHALLKTLGSMSRQVIVSQVVPELSAKLPIIAEYKLALNRFDSKLVPNEVSLEGFIIAKIFHQGLLAIKGDINKESIIDGIHSLNEVDIGLGVNISYADDKHQAINKVWLTRFYGERYQSFNWRELKQEMTNQDD